MADEGGRKTGIWDAVPPADFAGKFNYAEAFSRNLGWVSDWEQERLAKKKIAIAGMGGVGGIHLVTLARMGFQNFHISDLDSFELGNFNRQAGANMTTIGADKAATMARMAQEINPQARIKVFGDGVRFGDHPLANVEQFLDGVDLFVDGFDFFVLDVRAEVYKACREKGIPVVCAGPVGMGVAYLVFTKDSMSFEDYFGFGDPEREKREKVTLDRKYVNFLLGLTPAMMQTAYSADRSRVDFDGKRVPSTAMGCQFAAGAAATEAVKLLLGRGKVLAAPHYHHYDCYLNKFKVGYLRGGYRNPLQTLKRHYAYRFFKTLSKKARPREPEFDRALPMADVAVEAGRWAPSGDNCQPWAITILSDTEVQIRPRFQDKNPYEYNDGEPTWMALGLMLETMRLAASERGHRLDWQLERGEDPYVQVRFTPDDTVREDPLVRFIKLRSVDRGRYRTTPLSDAQRAALDIAAGPIFRVQWFEDSDGKKALTGLAQKAGELRLQVKEAFPVHKDIIDWQNRFSRTAIPKGAVGLNPVMVSAMGLMNRLGWPAMKTAVSVLPGAKIAAFEMATLPGRACAAHFALRFAEAERSRDNPEHLIRAGMGVQRFWLACADQDLALQPSLAPLIFAYYGRHDIAFTRNQGLRRKAKDLNQALESALGGQVEDCLFLGRVGVSNRSADAPRSIRRSADEIVTEDRRATPPVAEAAE